MKSKLKVLSSVTVLFLTLAASAENCDNNVLSAQDQGIEILLSRPQHKTTLNSTANEVRQNVNKGQVALSSSQSTGNFTITNTCAADTDEENFWECTYKKTVVKTGVLPESPPHRHSKEVKYRIGNIRMGTNSKCLADFSILESRERHGSED